MTINRPNLVFIIISSEQVLSNDLSMIKQLINDTLSDRNTTLNFIGRVCFGVFGYDDDPRELYQIPNPETPGYMKLVRNRYRAKSFQPLRPN